MDGAILAATFIPTILAFTAAIFKDAEWTRKTPKNDNEHTALFLSKFALIFATLSFGAHLGAAAAIEALDTGAAIWLATLATLPLAALFYAEKLEKKNTKKTAADTPT
ncbi:MAG: hypothetical protein QW445_07580 [Candidatus Bathyarchaeia archaeon]